MALVLPESLGLDYLSVIRIPYGMTGVLYSAGEQRPLSISHVPGEQYLLRTILSPLMKEAHFIVWDFNLDLTSQEWQYWLRVRGYKALPVVNALPTWRGSGKRGGSASCVDYHLVPMDQQVGALEIMSPLPVVTDHRLLTVPYVQHFFDSGAVDS